MADYFKALINNNDENIFPISDSSCVYHNGSTLYSKLESYLTKIQDYEEALNSGDSVAVYYKNNISQNYSIASQNIIIGGQNNYIFTPGIIANEIMNNNYIVMYQSSNSLISPSSGVYRSNILYNYNEHFKTNVFAGIFKVCDGDDTLMSFGWVDWSVLLNGLIRIIRRNEPFLTCEDYGSDIVIKNPIEFPWKVCVDSSLDNPNEPSIRCYGAANCTRGIIINTDWNLVNNSNWWIPQYQAEYSWMNYFYNRDLWSTGRMPYVKSSHTAPVKMENDLPVWGDYGYVHNGTWCALDVNSFNYLSISKSIPLTNAFRDTVSPHDDTWFSIWEVDMWAYPYYPPGDWNGIKSEMTLYLRIPIGEITSKSEEVISPADVRFARTAPYGAYVTQGTLRYNLYTKFGNIYDAGYLGVVYGRNTSTSPTKHVYKGLGGHLYDSEYCSNTMLSRIFKSNGGLTNVTGILTGTQIVGMTNSNTGDHKDIVCIAMMIQGDGQITVNNLLNLFNGKINIDVTWEGTGLTLYTLGDSIPLYTEHGYSYDNKISEAFG